jgi:hypothetical protein
MHDLILAEVCKREGAKVPNDLMCLLRESHGRVSRALAGVSRAFERTQMADSIEDPKTIGIIGALGLAGIAAIGKAVNMVIGGRAKALQYDRDARARQTEAITALTVELKAVQKNQELMIQLLLARQHHERKED